VRKVAEGVRVDLPLDALGYHARIHSREHRVARPADAHLLEHDVLQPVRLFQARAQALGHHLVLVLTSASSAGAIADARDVRPAEDVPEVLRVGVQAESRRAEAEVDVEDVAGTDE
jgi:hypothetical protein